MSIKAVIFDLGGVLLRTENTSPIDSLASKLSLTRKELENRIYNSSSSYKAMIGEIDEDEQWRLVLTDLGLPFSQLSSFLEVFLSGTKIDTDLLDYIRRLRPKYLTGLLSNAWSNARSSVESYYGGLDVFDVVVFSAEVGLAKPDPAIYSLILQKLAISASEAVFVDDILKNVQAAKDIGMHAFQFQTSKQTQRYIKELLDTITA